MKISKKTKKRLIQAIFLVPFFTCLITVVSIKSYIYERMALVCPDGNAKKLLLIIAFVLLINAVASFGSLVAYWCLENKVDSILRKERKRHHARKN